MPTINLLSQSMINKIAAGEVIERPASVVKELIENAVDAGATRINVAVERGGIDLIRIADDGCGIAPEQLTLALSPHATSKIADTDDLFRIRSFGFRGEALASIAEVAQMTLRSRPVESTEGGEIRSDGGTLLSPQPVGHPVGTTIEVRNLFYNTPVRRKYMKSTTTEFGHVVETFTRLALPHTHIHFTLRHNDRIVHDLPHFPGSPESDRLDRIGRLFGNDVVAGLIPVESPPGEVAVRGFVCHPNQSRSNNRLQYFFLNNRYIKDRSLQHALTEAYRGLLTPGRFPIAFLEIDMLPELFDVNVHPTKMEVRFLDSSRVYSRFLSTIREKFLRTDLHGRPDLPLSGRPRSEDAPGNAGQPTSQSALSENRASVVSDDDPRTAMDAGSVEALRQKVLDWAKHLPPANSPPLSPDEINARLDETQYPEEPFTSSRSLSPPSPHSPDSSSRRNTRPEKVQPGSPSVNLPISDSLRRAIKGGTPDFKRFEDGFAHDVVLDARQTTHHDSGSRGESGSSESISPDFSPPKRKLVQMHDRYLVLETPEGIAIADQHALHERILFENLKRQIDAGGLETQGLLVPVPIDLAPTEAACILENRDFLAGLGLAVDPFGGNTMLITSYPAILGGRNPKEILLSLLEPLLEAGKKSSRTDLLEEMLHQMACKAAVKAGDRLSESSVEELIDRAKNEAHAHHCPHGRPSMLVFTREELDKMFRRS